VFGNIASDAELAQKKLMTEAPLLTLKRDDKLAQGLIQVVTRALRRKPVDRYQSAEDLLKELLPLRDLARIAVAQVDIEKTVGNGAPMRASLASLPDLGPTSGPAAPTSAQPAPTDGRASVATPVPALDVRPAPPARGGVPVVVMVAAIAAALVGGAVLGSGILKPKEPGAAAEAAPAITAAAPAIVTAQPAAAPAPAPSASAAVALPEVADTAAAIAASAPKKLWGTIPKPSADPLATPTPTAALTAKSPAVVKPAAPPPVKAPTSPGPGGPPAF
jgi:hypothetical protein